MKKYLTFGLILSLVSGACFAEHPRVAQLIAEKQQKMKKLEDCQGTTKALKIAGISTLGLTAVGVAGNIAEAVVLNNAKEDVNKAKKALKTEEDRQEKLQAEQDKRVEEKRKEEAAQKAAEQFAQEFAQTCKDAQGTQNDKTCAVNDVDKNQLDKAHKMFSELLNMTCSGGDDSFECTKDDYKATGKVKAEVPAETKKEEPAPQPDAPVKQPEAEPKPEVQPEKPEPTKPVPTGEDEKAKIDAAFLTACTGYYKLTKGDAENSCTIHVADKTKTEDMDSVAVSKKLGDDVCPDNTVKKHDDKTKVFNCKTGTKPNRLYVKFDDIDDGGQGEKVPVICEKGQHKEGESCLPDERDCEADNSTSCKEIWNGTDGYKCSAITCNDGYDPDTTKCKCNEKKKTDAELFKEACRKAGYSVEDDDYIYPVCIIGTADIAIREEVEKTFKNVSLDGFECDSLYSMNVSEYSSVICYNKAKDYIGSLRYDYNTVKSQQDIDNQKKLDEQKKEEERKNNLSKLDDNAKINYFCRNQKQEQGRTVNTDGVASYCADAQTESSCNELNEKLQSFYPKTARFEWTTITFGDGVHDNVYTYNEQISGMAIRPELKVREVTRCWIRR